jgi:oxygen-independent coproporphyrinogen-3 oxidase
MIPMGGLYIHIPFCRQACRYCDFYFTVSIRYQDQFTGALLMELENRAGEAGINRPETLYFGGGTPSLLSMENMFRIMNGVRKYFLLDENAEITIECNPEDLDLATLAGFKESGINRLSIGIQSFLNRDLKLIRRTHDAMRAIQCVEDGVRTGFKNITADLIYGIPGQTAVDWKHNLDQACNLPLEHISAYHLTFEPGTVFDHWRKKGKLFETGEELSEEMFHMLREKTAEAGFEHYEISNFAKPGRKSIHNQLYWSGKPYLGMGPSAHSFDGTTRSWNVASLKKYMEGLYGGNPARESEDLSPREQYHDYLITSLRTREGADPEYIHVKFGNSFIEEFERHAKRFLDDGTLRKEAGHLVIDPGRWLLADYIIREMM